MGIVELPRIEQYWNTTNKLIEIEQIRNLFTLDEFKLIHRYFHLSDINTENENDKLRKIRTFADKKLYKVLRISLLERKYRSTRV